MTLIDRIAENERLIRKYRAEQIGLRQALIGPPIKREAFKSEDEWRAFQQGYEDGCTMLRAERTSV